MSSGIHIHILCIWLIVCTGVVLGYTRYARTIDVQRDRCYNLENAIEVFEEECKYGSFKDICGRKKCFGGPGDECKPHDEILRCHRALECNCNKCIGCLGQENCHLEICPSKNNFYSNWRKRFERNMHEFDV